MIEKYQPSKLYLFLDNDIEGCKTAESLIAEVQHIPISNKSTLYENYKDFNEMVMATSTTDRGIVL